MGMNSEKGEWREVWWNWKKRMEIADTHLKIQDSSCLHRKTQTLHCFVKEISNIFITSIYMENGKVLKKECEWSAAYAMAKVNIQGGKSCR